MTLQIFCAAVEQSCSAGGETGRLPEDFRAQWQLSFVSVQVEVFSDCFRIRPDRALLAGLTRALMDGVPCCAAKVAWNRLCLCSCAPCSWARNSWDVRGLQAALRALTVRGQRERV